jgi:agmatinase
MGAPLQVFSSKFCLVIPSSSLCIEQFDTSSFFF